MENPQAKALGDKSRKASAALLRYAPQMELVLEFAREVQALGGIEQVGTELEARLATFRAEETALRAAADGAKEKYSKIIADATREANEIIAAANAAAQKAADSEAAALTRLAAATTELKATEARLAVARRDLTALSARLAG